MSRNLETLQGIKKINVIETSLSSTSTDITDHASDTSNPHNVTKSQVGLSNVDNTTDLNKPISTATQTALNLKAPLASPTFTGTVSGVTKSMVGLSNVDNTTDLNKPISTATQSALDLKANQSTTYTKTQVDSAISTSVTTSINNLVNGAPAALDTLKELADAINDDASFASTVTTALGNKVDKTTTVNGHALSSNVTVTASDVGLGNVTNESKATMFTSPTFTGTVSGVTKSMVGLSNVDNTTDLNKPISTATQSALDLKANQSTTYTKTQVDSAIANLVNSAPASLDTLNELATALGNDANFATTVTNSLASKAPLASPTFTGTVFGITKSMVGLSNVDNTTDLNKPISTATQSALDLKAPLASPTFTGTVSGITKSMVGLGNVDNTSDLNKPISTATQSALDLKAPLASPTFTGTVSGITKSMVGLSNVDNTTDINKPISTATQTALNLKASQEESFLISIIMG